MKTIITLSAMSLISNTALAGAFEHEARIGSPDLVFSIHTSDSVHNPEVSNSPVRISLHDWYRGNPDVENLPYNHEGVELKFQNDFIGGYEVLSRDNPDLAS